MIYNVLCFQVLYKPGASDRMKVHELYLSCLDRTHDLLIRTVDESPSLLSDNAYSSIIKVAALLLAGLLAWRAINFRILPKFYPLDPKDYPYWIPGTELSEYSL